MRVLFVLLFTIITLTSTGQYFSFDELRFGVFTGTNYAIPAGEDMVDYKDDLEDLVDDIEDNGGDAKARISARLGFHLGVHAEYPLQDNFAVISSLSYSQKGFNIRTEYEDKYTTSYTTQNVITSNLTTQYVELVDNSKFKANVNLNYLDWPIGVKYQLDNGVNFFGGLLFSFLVSENVKYESENEDQSLNYTYDNSGNVSGANIITNSDSDSDTDDYDDTIDDDDPNSTLTGYQLGVGYGNDSYNLSFKLNNNSNFGDINGYGDDNKNITLQLSYEVFF